MQAPSHQSVFYWLPNALTLGRLAALPFLVFFIARTEGPTDTAAAALFAGIAITDSLDGFLARRLRAESAFGRVADPLADRLLVAVGLAALIWFARYSPAGPLMILTRDIAGVASAYLLQRQGRQFRVNSLGKFSSAMVMASIALSLWSTAGWINVMFWCSVTLSLLAFLYYAHRAARHQPAP